MTTGFNTPTDSALSSAQQKIQSKGLPWPNDPSMVYAIANQAGLSQDEVNALMTNISAGGGYQGGLPESALQNGPIGPEATAGPQGTGFTDYARDDTQFDPNFQSGIMNRMPERPEVPPTSYTDYSMTQQTPDSIQRGDEYLKNSRIYGNQADQQIELNNSPAGQAITSGLGAAGAAQMAIKQLLAKLMGQQPQ